MLQCGNGDCQTVLFHQPCIDLDATPTGDWYRSSKCASSTIHVHCVCQKKMENKDVVECASGPLCIGQQLYYSYCLSFLHENMPGK